MEGLVAATCLQRPSALRRDNAGAEDRYYRSHDPTNRRLLPLASIALVVTILALLIDLLPR
jgi:hypothetical protein